MTCMDPPSPEASARQARKSELALVARLRDGDLEAFDLVYGAFNTRLFNFLARLSRRRDVAEDLLEETWLRLVARAAQLRPDTQLGPWLFTVARNLHVSYRRSRMLEDSHAAGLIGLWPSGPPQPSPFEVAAANETGKRIETALGTLPVAYREAILLVMIEGLRPSEAAAVCGVSAEAMRQRLSRARAALTASLASEESAIAMFREVAT
jgi:RNA polymerase sigma-70 factor (ECF subfamily)